MLVRGWASTRFVAATAAAWFFLGVMVGCGDSSGRDKCNGTCKGKEQCRPIDVEEKCNFFWICMRRGYGCVDPAKVITPLISDDAEAYAQAESTAELGSCNPQPCPGDKFWCCVHQHCVARKRKDR